MIMMDQPAWTLCLNQFDQELFSLNVGLCSPNFAQRWEIVFWKQCLQTEAVDQAPKTDLRDCPRFLAQPLWRLSRVILYLNQCVLKCIKYKQSQTIEDRPAHKALDQQEWGLFLHWVCTWLPLGAAFSTRQTVSILLQIDLFIVQLIIIKFCRFSNAPFWILDQTCSNRFLQRSRSSFAVSVTLTHTI